MAFDKLYLKNPASGELKQAPVGFSFTTLFFGFFPALFRSDWKWAAIIFVIGWITLGFGNLVFAFIYNKLSIKDLIYANGFKVTGSQKNNLQRISNSLGIELPLLS